MEKLFLSVRKLKASYRFVISLILALFIFFILPMSMSLSSRMVVSTLTFTLSATAMIWMVILGGKGNDLRLVAEKEDSSVPLIFSIVLLLAFASLFTVILLLGSVKGLTNFRLTQHILFTIASVASSWILVHSLYILHYARIYYTTLKHEEKKLSETGLSLRGLGGVDFPGDGEPDYIDFAYFSFVIGMTSQVSDVMVTTPQMRKVVLTHGLLSFVFNTLIVAISINIIAGVIQR